MARKPSKKTKTVESKVSYLEKIEEQVQSNQSRVSLILGALILLVVGILIFNYFNKSKSEIGPSQQTTAEQDVSPNSLPGKYTVKDGDTLFSVATKYYNDGYKFTEIAKANNLSDVDSIIVGQVLQIPKLDAVATATPTPSTTESPSPTPTSSETPSPTPTETTQPVTSDNWGSAITDNTYTVVEGDWLSTISARAYNGDIMAYTKLAEANHIPNPDYIVPGMVLTIPR